MGNRFYPDINYQMRIYYELVAQYKGVDLKKYKKNKFINETKRCICPQCGEHRANFFRARDNNTFIMTCMEGCGLKMTLHQLVLKYGSQELKDRWKEELTRINRREFKKFGTALPIKNAGRPKGSKTNKKKLEPIIGMTDEIGTLGIRSALHWHRSANDERNRPVQNPS